MLLVPTYLAASRIHGTGLFAAQRIAEGVAVWVLDLTFDRTFTDAEFQSLPELARNFILHYGWKTRTGHILPADNDRFMNHSLNPNQVNGFALRKIEADEEITTNYADFDLLFMQKLRAGVAEI